MQHSVYNNPKLETTQMSINRRADEYMCHEHTVERHSAMSGPLGTHRMHLISNVGMNKGGQREKGMHCFHFYKFKYK